MPQRSPANRRLAIVRCPWAKPTNRLYVAYHDDEWGRPQHDDRHLFEMMVLEGAQAGLSWETILNKRVAYRLAFDRFDPHRVARYDKRKVASLLADEGLVRNKLKIASAIGNAQRFIEVQDEFGSFDTYLWRYMDGRQQVNRFERMRDIPPRTAISDALSKDLKKRGFRFVGSTIMYAYMQAVGLVDDHLIDCHRHGRASRARG